MLLKISPNNWEGFMSHVTKEDEKFRKTYHKVKNEIEPVIMKYFSLNESASDSDVEQQTIRQQTSIPINQSV